MCVYVCVCECVCVCVCVLQIINAVQYNWVNINLMLGIKKCEGFSTISMQCLFGLCWRFE